VSEQSPRHPAFDISPEVVFRLGDELITDELQALVELVKNSYDASATKSHVHIDCIAVTEGKNGAAKANAPKMVGWLEVRDDGDGMNREQVDHGWLLISASGKRAMKDAGKTNRLGRTPLGDKGLGRLGVLRLGRRVEIRTRPRGRAEEHILRFDRADFERNVALSDVDLHYERAPLEKDETALGGWRVASPYRRDVACTPIDGRHGTVIRISGLNNAQVWQDHLRVQRELMSLISPFEPIDKFEISLKIVDAEGERDMHLGEVAELRRDLADIRWEFDFDGERLSASGRFKLGAFEPSGTNEILSPFWAEHVEPDRGAEYRRRLVEGPLEPLEANSPDGPWWLGLTLSIALSDVVVDSSGRVRLRTPKDEQQPNWTDPGPFEGELDSFSLGPDVDLSVHGTALFESQQMYRRWVRDVRGVKVFRDGFGVRVGEDFLGLGAGFTGARSFYALRPGNVVGFVAISAASNRQLQETTDREGFVANRAYRTFAALLRTLIDRIGIVQSQIGRELRSWFDEVAKPPRATPSERAAELAHAAAERETRTRDAVAAVRTIRQTLNELGDGAALLTTTQAKEAQRAAALLDRLSELMEEGESLRQDLDELGTASKSVEKERAQLRDQLRVAYQTVGLGVVAETVAHEMTNITGRLQARADTLAPQFKGEQHRAARALVAEIKTTVRAIRLQLRHLEPQLRYQRTRREVLDAMTAVKRVGDYHRARLEPAGIAVDVSGEPFDVRVNRGRTQQALDNLLINSEFWLGHARTEEPRIDIHVSSPFVTVRDNGPGVDPGIETAIFEPFVSGRPGEEGRGLGLFITRHVLGDDGVTIHLGKREADGRRRSFVLDFAGAIPDATDA
jgi:signal transduction histidine kinase